MHETYKIRFELQNVPVLLQMQYTDLVYLASLSEALPDSQKVITGSNDDMKN